jgi:4a-hydroxytetrahydrobiopterin dehydratase
MQTTPPKTMALADEHCARLTRTAKRVADSERDVLLQQLCDWRRVSRGGVERLERQFRFADFAGALAFTNRIGALADAEDHHPAIVTEWGRVSVGWWTHVVGGLHRNDFVMAAQTDRAYAIAMS